MPGRCGTRRTFLDIQAIEQAYRRYARFYDVCFGAVFQPGRRAIVERMNCGPGERILEVGVGTGLSLPLYPSNVSVVGIDVSRDMLDQARVRRARCGLDHVAKLIARDQFELKVGMSSVGDGSSGRSGMVGTVMSWP